MNLYHLELFWAVAEEGSVTRGAERLAVSQPSVSRAIADLENVVGERLLDRGPKGVVPTEAGRVLLGYAQRIFALEREAGEALADLRGLETGRLSIGASTTIGDYLLPPAISRFLSYYPGIDLTVEVANTEVIQDGVLHGRYEVGFTEGEVDAGRFEVRVLTDDDLVVFAAPQHALTMKAQVTVEELSPYGFVMREAGSGTRTIVEHSFERAGVPLRIACSLGSTTAIKRAVASGLGLGVASSLSLASEFARGELIQIRTPLKLTRQLHKVRLSWRRESAALRRFCQFLDDYIAMSRFDDPLNVP